MSRTDALLAELDAEERTHAWGLAAKGRLPNPSRLRREQDEWLARQRQRYAEGLPRDSECPDIVRELFPLTPHEQRELRRLKSALEAATDATTFVALVRGEAVPRSRLNQRLVQAHRRRQNP